MTEASALFVDQPAVLGPGRLVLVGGPSGAGKDTLLGLAKAACANDPGIVFPRRVITREASPSEDNEEVSPDAFRQALARGATPCIGRRTAIATRCRARSMTTSAPGARWLPTFRAPSLPRCAAPTPMSWWSRSRRRHRFSPKGWRCGAAAAKESSNNGCIARSRMSQLHLTSPSSIPAAPNITPASSSGSARARGGRLEQSCSSVILLF